MFAVSESVQFSVNQIDAFPTAIQLPTVVDSGGMGFVVFPKHTRGQGCQIIYILAVGFRFDGWPLNNGNGSERKLRRRTVQSDIRFIKSWP